MPLLQLFELREKKWSYFCNCIFCESIAALGADVKVPKTYTHWQPKLFFCTSSCSHNISVAQNFPSFFSFLLNLAEAKEQLEIRGSVHFVVIATAAWSDMKWLVLIVISEPFLHVSSIVVLFRTAYNVGKNGTNLVRLYHIHTGWGLY